jgi:hypothetical protein
MIHPALQTIVEQSQAVRLPRPWHFVKSTDNIRRLSIDESELLTLLTTQFPEQDLVNARILSRNATGEPRLLKVLCQDDHFMVLKREKDSPPLDIVNHNGRFSGNAPPALDCLTDHQTHCRSVKCKWLLVSFSNADMALFSMLGLPVTPAIGLDKISGEQARKLLCPPALNPLASDPGITCPSLAAEKVKLVLVGADVCALRGEYASGFLAAASQFERIERALKIPTESSIGVWLPSVADFLRIRDGIELRDQQLVRKTIENGARGALSIEQFLAETSGPRDDDVLAARSNLEREISELGKSTFGMRSIQDQLAAYLRALNISNIEPAVHEGAIAPDPMDRSLLNSAAELMKLQFESSDIVQRARAAIASGRAVNIDCSLDDRLTCELRLADGLMKIKKALRRD